MAESSHFTRNLPEGFYSTLEASWIWGRFPDNEKPHPLWGDYPIEKPLIYPLIYHPSYYKFHVLHNDPFCVTECNMQKTGVVNDFGFTTLIFTHTLRKIADKHW